MPVNPYPGRAAFGLLPEPERSPVSLITSMVVNGLLLAFLFYVGAAAKKALDQHRYEETLLVLPAKPEPPQPKMKLPPPPPEELPPVPDVKLEAPKINLPKPEPKPELKPIPIEIKLPAPVIQSVKPKVIEAPQPKSVLNTAAKPAVVQAQQTKTAMAAAAMPAQDNRLKPSTKPVHFGDTFGVTPNPNAKGPATVAAIGNPYGGMQGPAVAPHGIVGSTGLGNGTKFGSNAGVVGKVASAGGRVTTSAPPSVSYGKVASVGIPAAPTAAAEAPRTVGHLPTDLVVISKPQPKYTSEAKQLKVQGDVILRVTFAANGQVMVQGIVHSLGHGLDEEARRVAQQIRFRPATRNGQAVDMTTNITITFQLA